MPESRLLGLSSSPDLADCSEHTEWSVTVGEPAAVRGDDRSLLLDDEVRGDLLDLHGVQRTGPDGFTGGAALGGFIAAWLIPAFGWRAVFYFGGTIPLVIALLMYFLLPESLQFMVVRRKSQEQIGKWLKRVDPNAVSLECLSFNSLARSKNSSSFGFEPGQPPSM